MSAAIVAKRYARAFIATLTTDEVLRAESAAFLEFCEMARANAELSALFANVTIGSHEKVAVVKALGDKLGLSLVVGNFLKALAANGRLDILKYVAAAVADALDEKMGVTAVSLTTAVAPDEAGLKAFSAKMEKVLGGTVRINTTVDSQILGGAIAQVGSTVFDGSVRGQLQNLRKEMVKEI